MLIQTSALSASPELFYSYDYGLRHYEVKASEGVINVKTPGVRLSLERKECNKKLYDSFVKRNGLYMGKFPHVRIEKPTKKEFKKVIYRLTSSDGPYYMAFPQSVIGQYLLKLPENFVVTKRQAMLACKKESKPKSKK
jgi:hypothetical protein